MDCFVKKRQEQIWSNIVNSLNLQKGNQGFPPGTIRVWNGNRYKKDVMGNWNYIGKEKENKDKKYLDKIQGKITVYRAIEVEDGDLSKIDKNELGNHWTFDESAVVDYIDKQKMNPLNIVYLSATVDINDVNWKQTVMQNKYYNNEKEAFLDTKNDIKVVAENFENEQEEFEGEVGYRISNNDEESMASDEGVTDEDIKNFIEDLKEWANVNIKEK